MSWWFIVALALAIMAILGHRRGPSPPPPAREERSKKPSGTPPRPQTEGERLRSAYAVHHLPDGRMIPLTKEGLEAKLATTREKLRTWKRLAAKAETGVVKAINDDKPNPSLRQQLEASLGEIQSAEKDVEGLLGDVTFKNESSYEVYQKLVDQLTDAEFAIADAVDQLAFLEEPDDED